jgi:carboxypeptidase PM20D1
VGIAEKGLVTVELKARVAGGYSSVPPRQSAVGILSAAVARLENTQMAARLEGPTRQLFDRIGPRFPTMQRAVFANLWLTAPLLLRSLEESPTTNAMVRTTTAPTIFQAGTKDNVLASQGRAVINFRILPGDTVASVVEHVKYAIDDSRVRSRPSGVSRPSRQPCLALTPVVSGYWSGRSGALFLMRSSHHV